MQRSSSRVPVVASVLTLVLSAGLCTADLNAAPNRRANEPYYRQVNVYYGTGMQTNTDLSGTIDDNLSPPIDFSDTHMDGAGNSVSIGGLYVRNVNHRFFIGGELDANYGDDTAKTRVATSGTDFIIRIQRTCGASLNARAGIYLGDEEDISLYGKVGIGSTVFQTSAQNLVIPDEIDRKRNAVWHANLGMGIERHIGNMAVGLAYSWQSSGKAHALITNPGYTYDLRYRPSGHMLRISIGTKF